MSRGQWVAFGSTLAALGCSSPASPGPVDQQQQSTVAGDGGGDDASLVDAIACGAATCDRATQFCDSTAQACASLPESCGGRATCECTSSLRYCSGSSSCAVVAPSVLAFTCIPSGSNGCYGCPPARPGWARRVWS